MFFWPRLFWKLWLQNHMFMIFGLGLGEFELLTLARAADGGGGFGGAFSGNGDIGDLREQAASAGAGGGAAAAPGAPYAGLFGQMAANAEEANRIARLQLAMSERVAAMQDERYQYWDENFKPLEQELIDKAKVGIDPEYAAILAGNRMDQAYKSTEGMVDRNRQRLGIDPNDPKYDPLDRRLDLDRTAAITGARNMARLGTLDTNANMKLAVAGMGRGVPMESLQAFNSSASSLANAGASTMRANPGMASAYTTGLNASVNQGQLAGQATQWQSDLNSSNNLQTLQDKNRLYASLAKMGGTAIGAWAGQQGSTLGGSNNNPNAFYNGQQPFDSSFSIRSGY